MPCLGRGYFLDQKIFLYSNGLSTVWHVNRDDGILLEVTGVVKCTRNCRWSGSLNVDAGQDDQHVP